MAVVVVEFVLELVGVGFGVVLFDGLLLVVLPFELDVVVFVFVGHLLVFAVRL